MRWRDKAAASRGGRRVIFLGSVLVWGWSGGGLRQRRRRWDAARGRRESGGSEMACGLSLRRGCSLLHRRICRSSVGQTGGAPRQMEPRGGDDVPRFAFWRRRFVWMMSETLPSSGPRMRLGLGPVLWISRRWSLLSRGGLARRKKRTGCVEGWGCDVQKWTRALGGTETGDEGTQARHATRAGGRWCLYSAVVTVCWGAPSGRGGARTRAGSRGVSVAGLRALACSSSSDDAIGWLLAGHA